VIDDDMTRKDKLRQRMQQSPSSIRFEEVEALLRSEGFVLFNQRGSHQTWHHMDGRLLTIVRPHGGRKTCHPADIKRLIKVLQS
jgi:predicted RNA binding protein YcfA (HicA-like mRNA interferase family)